MSHFPDARAAARGRPVRFLTLSWPRRSLAHVATTVPVGLVASLALALSLSACTGDEESDALLHR